jgi:putative transposase
MNRLTHPFIPGAYYHITARTHRRMPIFEDERLAKIAFDDFTFYGAKYNIDDLAHIVLNNHIHWLFQPGEEKFAQFAKQQHDKGGKYSSDPDRYFLVKIMEDYKRHVAYEINKIRNTRGTKIWQAGFYDRILYTNEEVKQAANYVIFNSTKDGLVHDPKKYPFVGGSALGWEWW